MATAQTQQQTWHAVTPQIADPDLAPAPAALSYSDAQLAGNVYPNGVYPGGPHPIEQTRGSFFSDHKFAIIVSVVVLIILIVILYVYLTRRGDNRKSNVSSEKSSQRGGQSGIPHEKVDVEELNRLRAERQLHRKRMQSGASGSSAKGATPPQAAQSRPPVHNNYSQRPGTGPPPDISSNQTSTVRGRVPPNTARDHTPLAEASKDDTTVTLSGPLTTASPLQSYDDTTTVSPEREKANSNNNLDDLIGSLQDEVEAAEEPSSK